MTSQTSFPSQTGPIDSNIVPRSSSLSAEDRQQHPDPEVEALGHEVARPEEAEEAEPEDLEGHLSTPAPAAALPPRPRGRPRADRTARTGASGRGRRGRAPGRGTTNTPRLRPTVQALTVLETASSVFREPVDDPRLAPRLGEDPAGEVGEERERDRRRARPAGTTWRRSSLFRRRSQRAPEREEEQQRPQVGHHAHAPVDEPHVGDVVARAVLLLVLASGAR